MKHIIITSIGAVGSFIAGLLGGWDSSLVTLLIFMAIDYITGLIVAGVFHKSKKSESGALESRAGFKGLIKKDASVKEVLSISRIAVFIIAAIAFVLSLDENSSIFGLVSYAWAGFGATFGPLILLALFWKGATAKGAIAGLITGGVTVVAWHNIPASVCPIFGVYEILPAFILCLVVAVVVSLLDKNKDPQVIAEFEAFKKMED